MMIRLPRLRPGEGVGMTWPGGPWQDDRPGRRLWQVLRRCRRQAEELQAGWSRRCRPDRGPLLLGQARFTIGLYTTSKDDRCRWLVIDFDRHDGDPEGLAERNRTLALAAYETLRNLGFHPLLIDSNGRGGLHLIVLFAAPVPAREARRFGRWLVRDWAGSDLPREPEVFPKQDSIGTRYGNFVRLFGRHYKRPFYSKVWDGANVASGEAAIEIILGTQGDPSDLVPSEDMCHSAPTRDIPAIPSEASATPSDSEPWWKGYAGDLRTLDILGLFESRNSLVSWSGGRQAEVVCPWAGEHTTGDEQAGVLTADEDEGRFPVFHCFHAHCEGRGLREVLESFGLTR